MIVLLLMSALPTFGAPLPKDLVEVTKSTELDAYGQEVNVTVLRADAEYRTVKRFYRRRFGRSRAVQVRESLESRQPGYVPDPRNPKTYMHVLRVLNLDYERGWAAVYVRPLEEGALLVVVERKPPPEVSGAKPPGEFEIPRSVYEAPGLTKLERSSGP